MGKHIVQLGSIGRGKHASFCINYYPLYSYGTLTGKGSGKRNRRPAYFLWFGAEDQSLCFSFTLSPKEWRNFVQFLKWTNRLAGERFAVSGFEFYEKPAHRKNKRFAGVIGACSSKSQSAKIYKAMNVALKREGKKQMRFSKFLNEKNWPEIQRTNLDDSISLEQHNKEKDIYVDLTREQFIKIRTCCLKADHKLSHIKHVLKRSRT